jgi:hypothetical protein
MALQYESFCTYKFYALIECGIVDLLALELQEEVASLPAVYLIVVNHDTCHVHIDAQDVVAVNYCIKGEPVIGGVGGFHSNGLWLVLFRSLLRGGKVGTMP